MESFLIVLIFLFLPNIKCDVLSDCVCGSANIFPGRIVAGYETSPHKYPWMAAMLTTRNDQLCGGAIIGDRTILTAGHCMFYPKRVIQTSWLLGSHSIKQSKSDQKNIYKIMTFEYHPNWQNGTGFDDYDMALVTLDRKITFSENVKPICLPEPNQDKEFEDKMMIVAGWGKLKDGGETSDTLQETKIALKTSQNCIERMAPRMKFNVKSMLCGYMKATDACQGDSGGPLFQETQPGRFSVLGVVSFGAGCAGTFPGVYGKITEPETLKWIHEYLRDSGSNTCSDPTRFTY